MKKCGKTTACSYGAAILDNLLESLSTNSKYLNRRDRVYIISLIDPYTIDLSIENLYLIPITNTTSDKLMPEVSRTYRSPNDIDVELTEITDGIYRIAGFVKDYGITFNQFLIEDEQPTLIHTGPIGMYDKIEEKVKEVIPLEKLAYIAFLPFESDEWGGNGIS
jgi:hypothetical protein